jgi:phage tail-like protein
VTLAPFLTGLSGSSIASDVARFDDPPLGTNFLIMMADTTSHGSFLSTAGLSLVTDVLFGGFTDCTGIEMTYTDTKTWEGGRNDAELRFPGHITWTNLVLKHGVSRLNQTGWDWLYSYGQGKVRRMDGLIMLLDSMHLPHTIWTIKRAFPVKFTGPSLQANTSAVAIETLELAHEGMWLLPTSASAAVF